MKPGRFALGSAVLLAAVLLATTNTASGAPKHRAGLVVRYGDNHTEQMCVFFDEASISGLDLLERSGEHFVAERSALGSAICKIDEQGCDYPDEDCFCKYPNFWGYWNRDPGERVWRFADTGASDHDVKDGAVEGWSWGPNGAPAPPLVAFDKVCPATAGSSPASTSKNDNRTKDGSTSAPKGTSGAPRSGANSAGTDEPVASSLASSPTDVDTTADSFGSNPPLAQEPASSSDPNYAAFAGFAALFALAAGGVVLLRKRRT